MKEILRLTQEPQAFRQEVDALPDGSWIVIDEIQKMPVLLDEVHAVMNNRHDQIKFAITGSSARKIRRTEVNLLAGRAVNYSFFPLTLAELEYKGSINDLLAFGTLPLVRTIGQNRADKEEVLSAYIENYLAQEVKAEALVRNLQAFIRFLRVAAIVNGNVTNIAGIARDAGVARPTVQGHFAVLEETLIGHWLPAWRPKARVKEVAHPKFYLFDSGVARALAGRHHLPLNDSEKGILLETLLFAELRAYRSTYDASLQIAYWRSVSGREVDFILTSRTQKVVGIEVKAATRWKQEYGSALKEMKRDKAINACYGVYLGSQTLKDGPVTVYPLVEFVRRLNDGALL